MLLALIDSGADMIQSGSFSEFFRELNEEHNFNKALSRGLIDLDLVTSEDGKKQYIKHISDID